MSTDRTPIDRAAEEVKTLWLHEEVDFEKVARAVLSAALTNDADPDFGARELFVADSGQDGSGMTRTMSTRPASGVTTGRWSPR